MIPDKIKEKIDNNEYTFMDKLMTGGLGYGSFCIPDELPHIILAIVFPPLATIWNYKMGNYENLAEFIKKFFKCFILTMFFYFPGLLYAINDIGCRAKQRLTHKKIQKARGKM
tara:strand:+ start:332 stop:670 length:339 start_codon:yes stop_codon:yes gene_type:complete